MEMDYKPPVWKLILIVAALLSFIVFCLSSCEVLKKSSSSSAENTSLQKQTTATTDSSTGGALKKQNSITKEDYDWFKTTLQFAAPAKDTNITNIYNYTQPGQPATIIYEGGKGSRQTEQTTIDSTWFKNALSQMQQQLDSTNTKLSAAQSQKHTETKGVGLITVLLIVGGGLLAYRLLGFASNFTIVKKVK